MKIANIHFVVDDDESDIDPKRARSVAGLKSEDIKNSNVPLAIVIGTAAVGALGTGVFFLWKKVIKIIDNKKLNDMKERRERLQSKAKNSNIRGIYDTHDSMLKHTIVNIPRNRSANNKKNKARRKEKRIKKEEQSRIEMERTDRKRKTEEDVKRRNQEAREIEEMSERDKTFTTVSYYSTTAQDARNRAAAQAAASQESVQNLSMSLIPMSKETAARGDLLL